MKAALWVWRKAVTMAGLIGLWQLAWIGTGRQPYLLPSPLDTAEALIDHWDILGDNALTTLSEIILGLLSGTAFGTGIAILLAAFKPLQRWVLPLIISSQSLPVFGIAPLLVLWFGYGIAPKIVMATAMIFFPVASALYDGLRRTEKSWLDLAHSLGARKGWVMMHVRLPAALPAFASGLRMAAVAAPISAIIGEWVGATSGLGALMIRANAHVQINLMFAALIVLAVLSLIFYHAVDLFARWLIPWGNEPAKQ